MTYVVTIVQNYTFERTLVVMFSDPPKDSRVWHDDHLLEVIEDELSKPHWDQVPYVIKSIVKADRVLGARASENAS